VLFYSDVPLPSQKDHKIDAEDLSVIETRFQVISSNDARCIAAETKSDRDCETKKPASRPKNMDGEICLNSKWITDVDRIQVSDEKREQMMKKARAISRAISKKAAQFKQNLPASTEQSHAESDWLSTRAPDDFIQSAGNTSEKQPVGGKSGWRIPRVKSAQMATYSGRTVGNQPTLVSKVSPPLSKEGSSSFGWNGSSHSTGHFRKTGTKASNRSFTSRQMQGVKTEADTARLVVSSCEMPTSSSSNTAAPNVTEINTVDMILVNSVVEVSTDVPVVVPNSSCSGHDSSQNPLRVPSREMIEKIESSSKQKSAILLPNAVPARGERGTAVGIDVPSQKNCRSNLNITRTDTFPTTVNIPHISPMAGNTSILPLSLSTSPSQSVATKKRKLNISQYKSILPQRQKSLLQSPAVTQPVELPAVYVYGCQKDILHDHDYIGETNPSTGLSKESSAENLLVLPKSTETISVQDKVSNTTEVAADAREVSEGETKRDVAVSVNSSVARLTLQSKPAASPLSAAFKFKPEAEFVCEGGNDGSAHDKRDMTVDCMPAYFDVVALPNRQMRISVSTDTLLTKKRHNPQPVVIADNSDSAPQLSEVHSDNALHCEKDEGSGIESRVCLSPRQRLDSEAVNVESRCSSRSSSVSSAISVSSDEESSRSRSSSRHRSSRESSYSSVSRFGDKWTLF